MSMAESAAIAAIRSARHVLRGEPDDFTPIVQRAADARVVLLGEASHGTHEFYRVRAAVTKQLIREQRISAIIVEADWPDAWRVHRYVTGRAGADPNASEALAGFRRFPHWMWRNADVLDFVGWLRAHNDGLPPAERVGFFGMDLYSLHASIDAVITYLEGVDPEAAARARDRYRCFDIGSADPQRYGRLVSLGLLPGCERAALAQFTEMQAQTARQLQADGFEAVEDQWFAEENARLVRSAEQYYRTLFEGPASSWNVRDRHMMQTVASTVAFLETRRPNATALVWAHNSHLGDARATEMREMGELNVGQLARERYGRAACLVGFSTFSGTVTAATAWDRPAQCMAVRPALPESYEALLHAVATASGTPDFLLDLGADTAATAALRAPRLQRAIGVIYRPETERQSHYLRACLPAQFDLLLHYDRTRAVEPLEGLGTWQPTELPETYPSAL